MFDIGTRRGNFEIRIRYTKWFGNQQKTLSGICYIKHMQAYFKMSFS